MYKKTTPTLDGDLSEEPDEGWWASVLADEEIYSSKEVPSKSGGQPKPKEVDWESIKQLYDQDGIVNLKVQSFNRGGLLVEGNGLEGFVPISHLIDMPTGLDEDQKQAILAGYVGRELKVESY